MKILQAIRFLTLLAVASAFGAETAMAASVWPPPERSAASANSTSAAGGIPAATIETPQPRTPKRPAAATQAATTAAKQLPQKTQPATANQDEIEAKGTALDDGEPMPGTAPLADINALMDGVKDHLRRALAKASRDKDRAPRLDLARFYIFRDDPEKALQHLVRAGPGSDSDVFWPLLTAYTYLRLGEQQKAAPLLENSLLATRALLPLSIRTAKFCESVVGLGQYEPRMDKPFSSEEETVIYLEISGAMFKETPQKQQGLRFTFGAEINDEMQHAIWKRNDIATHAPQFQRLMPEIYCTLLFTMPKLESQQYVLRIYCRDEQAGQTCYADIPFNIKGAAERGKKAAPPQTMPLSQ